MGGGAYLDEFTAFVDSLRDNINPSIAADEAIEMLSQHLITKPVFEALFENYSFVKSNPVSQSMQGMIDLLESQAMEKDTESLTGFYESVRKRAEGIDNAEGKQRIIIELYDKFFKIAFPKMVEKLGIVYTPVEVVDFIIRSVEDVLQKEFGRSLTDKNVNILDPFTGTGTFVTRLLQSGLIKPKDLPRKYTSEIHANEIVLLAYYIAAVNIENAYHDITGAKEFEAFDGICLTDTFQLGEDDGSEREMAKILGEYVFAKNNKRVKAQRNAPLRVIMGNPPYSIGQKDANDNAKNQTYEKLESRIEETYATNTKAVLNKALYDSYIKAFRWASDRLDTEHGGVIAFVSNGAWLDGNSTAGFRKCVEEEFSSIYVFNLRGNQRTSGELSRQEGGKIFGSGSRTPVSITLMVKNPNAKAAKATIHYRDIGDYLKREEKLSMLAEYGSIDSPKMEWTTLEPNEHGDWINHRNEAFDTFIAIDPLKNGDQKCPSIFSFKGPGVSTGRDAWVCNYSERTIQDRMKALISFYNRQVQEYSMRKTKSPQSKDEELLDADDKQIKWTRALRNDAVKSINHSFNNSYLADITYRPFSKAKLYNDRCFLESPGLSYKIYPTPAESNCTICISGIGSSKSFSALVSDKISCYDFLEKTQCFPMHYYEENSGSTGSLFDKGDDYVKRDGITDFILTRAQQQYSKKVVKEDIFYYVYGILHSPDYRKAFENDLKKMLPRIPLVEEAKDFWAFSKAGRELADLHIHYESAPACPDVTVTGLPESGKVASDYFRVEKMRFPKKDQKDTIIYNSRIKLTNIPLAAYDYVVNGRSAIDWIIERYQVSTHTDSGITNDPNDWAKEQAKPRYILDLLLSIITVSLKTNTLVASLPKLTFK